jgi:hypothetical protein
MMHLLATITTVLTLAQAPAATPAEQLQDAARKGDAAAVRKLLDEGVDVNTKFRYGTTAIFFACDAGQIEVVKVLLDHNADLSVKDTFYGMTPLALAVSPPRKKMPVHNEIAKLLIAKGAPGKDMALSAAIDDEDEELAKVVLDSGGLTPDALSDALEEARAGRKMKMAAFLEKAGAKPYEDFPLDAAQLAKFVGTYREQRGSEIVLAVDGKRLSAHFAGAPPDQRAPLSPRDATTFRAIGVGGAMVAFKVDGDKVIGFTIAGMGPLQTYTRVEGK